MTAHWKQEKTPNSSGELLAIIHISLLSFPVMVFVIVIIIWPIISNICTLGGNLQETIIMEGLSS